MDSKKFQKNIKTAIDLRFEHYLLQEGITDFEYEPFSTLGKELKIPDYLVVHGKSALVEIKEIETIPLDHVKGAGTMDAMGVADIMRKKIKKAKKQLKPHKEKADYTIILLGKNKGFALSMRDLEWAMYGDPVIRLQINKKNGAPRGKPYFDYKAKGAMRKNDPVTKERYFPASYISAVGIIKETKGYEYYLSRLYEKYMSPYNRNAPPEKEVKRAFKEFEEIQKKHKHTIPNKYQRDRKKLIFRLELIANVLSDSPLPK